MDRLVSDSSERNGARGEEAPWRTRDGLVLHTRHWRALGEPWANVLLLHGIGEHLGRYERTADLLAEAGLDAYGFDLRGHGRSAGRRAYVRRWDDFLDDVQEALSAFRTTAAVEGSPERLPAVLFGHSMGALIALTYACSERPAPDALVLSAPPLEARIPAGLRLVAPILSAVMPTHVVENPIDGSQLSADPGVGRAYAGDPLVQSRTTARLGAEMLRAMRRARRDLVRLQVPTLVIHGGDDTLVPTAASEPLARLSCVERRVLPGLRHETLNEPEGPEIVAGIIAWLRAHLVPAGNPADPTVSAPLTGPSSIAEGDR